MAEVRKTFDHDLLELKKHLLKMGERVDKAVERSIKALIENDIALAEKVISRDKKINDMEDITDDKVIQLITQQQPVAKDLRKVITALKMNASLERMGDLARNIASAAVRIDKKPSDATAVKIAEMASVVQSMVRGIMQAYLEENGELAKEVAAIDDKLDSLYKNYLNYLFSAVDVNSKSVEEATQYAFIGRHLERIGDHVTNIAELLVYLEEAKKFDLNN
ncbi:phosphate signaling complex protein PhoU [Desulfuribacillus alkaliarsenatis]|uniref:Phosphate-specific transport system accessory protein PhoU n=1 Tax=Desulfuribacillus alkaliarsenatis TaxID=766136 RepID=A0A1E5FYE6_9FIRM|nr:phosphate signaling complex protein PhoU [Desulfuribacillus alkaliarsenatis]OEF95593.1 phosphate transport system regulatory protein PhoU [Desulfuribacillus alkaliarsenatis]